MKNNNTAILKFASSMAFLLTAYIPTLKWMIERWLASDSYYGHGFLVPVISLYIIWQRRNVLKNYKTSTHMSALAIIVTGLLIHIICAGLKVYFISGFSFVFVIYGLVLFFFGNKIAKDLLFPVFFLLTMIPLPLVVIGNLIVRLKLFAMQVSIFILNRMGFPSIRDGSLIRMPNSYIAIGDPCSGLRSLIALLTLGLLFAFTAKVSYAKKATVFMLSAPIAIFSNVTRITMLAMVNDLYGQKAAMGFFHDFSGFLVFGIAFAALFFTSKKLENTKENEAT